MAYDMPYIYRHYYLQQKYAFKTCGESGRVILFLNLKNPNLQQVKLIKIFIKNFVTLILFEEMDID